MIQIKSLAKSFRSTRVLQDVNLTIPDGESLVIIGRSGCGKSVLLKHIIGLLKPDAGEVVIDGVDIVPLNERQLAPVRQQFGMLFQGAALFDSMTVAENIAFALERLRLTPKEVARRVAESLEIVGLAGTQEKMPAELSGGMKKRVALARAVVGNPKVLLFDEPTTGLDPITADSINNLILDLCERFAVTSIAVTHDMVSAYKIADRIAMLHEGRIHATGTPEEIQAAADPVVDKFIHGRAEAKDDGH
ncbi:MAG: ABC transporter ATP-binding protein [Verrucomicrobiae bacterium]|nr:ABC transporter ATP-binding protein [Verrucomicrobiae bacterium]